MFGDSAGSRIIAVAVALMGITAVVVGVGGLYVVLTASDEPPDRGAEVLGEYGCEPADRDVRSVPDASDVEQTVVDGARIAERSINTSEPAAGARINLSVEDTLLNVSATRFDDGPESRPNVTTEEDVIIVTDPQREPFRLWIDELAEGTVIRTEIDVCPPADPP